MTFLSRVFRHKDDSAKKDKHAQQNSNDRRSALIRPRYVSTWDSTHIEPDEVEELLHGCTLEIKSRAEALDTPFLLLPFRPEYDSNSSKIFMKNFYAANREGRSEYTGNALQQELRLSTPEVLCSIVKWCWARLPGGVVSWNIYELFRLGESESGMLRTSFDTFIPLSAPSESVKNIIYDFFDLLAAIAAHGKVNGLTGSKLSRLAGWWAFAAPEDAAEFTTAYNHWASAAEAASHLFFAYLRSRAPEDVDGTKGISSLPRSLQALVAQTEYPPQIPALMQTPTYKVSMIVDTVSPDPFTLLRRANHFEFRAQDKALQQFADCLDPTQALTEECRRVLQAIAAANQSPSAMHTPKNISSFQLSSGLDGVGDDGWSRFQDMGFSSISSDTSIQTKERAVIPLGRSTAGLQTFGPQSGADSKTRPTTPSWADFLSEKRSPPLFLPASQSLPALHGGPERLDSATSLGDDLEPGELASTIQFKLDDAFWWVWITSLAGEEPAKRKAAFGRCALIETYIPDGRWLVMEEQLKGASAGPVEGAYIAEKKSRFGFTRRKASTRRKETSEKSALAEKAIVSAAQAKSTPPSPGANVSFDQQLMIKAAAVELARKTRGDKIDATSGRRGRFDDASSVKTNSMLTLNGMKDLQPALKWANNQEKEAIRKQYLGSGFTIPDAISEQNSGSGDLRERELPTLPPSHMSQGSTTPHLDAQLQVASQVPLPAATPREDGSHPASVHEIPAAQVDKTEFQPPSPIDSARLKDSPKPDFSRDLSGSASTVGSPDRRSVHPALRDDMTPGEEAAQIGARAAWQGVKPPSSPESPLRKADRAKLTKPRTGNTSGIRKMFSRNKRSAPRSSEDSATSQTSGNTAGLVRQGSILRNELTDTNSVPQKTSPSVSQALRPSTPPPVGATVPEHLLPPGVEITPPHAIVRRDFAQVSASPVDTLDQKEANEHFSRFDQGMPASPVKSSIETSPTQPSQPEQPAIEEPPKQQESTDDYVSRPKQINREESVYVTPMDISDSFDPNQPISAIEEAEEEDSPIKTEPEISQSERWAAIRRNVAVRTNTQDAVNASRESGEEGVQEHTKIDSVMATEPVPEKQQTVVDDGGETSGEESIEKRVARIKARVAHLTSGQPKRKPEQTSNPPPTLSNDAEPVTGS